MNSIKPYLEKCQCRVVKALKRRLPSINKQPRQLNKAMNYAVLNGGKRLRSALIYAIGETLNGKESVLDDVSAVIEIIHASSLIHDDLPALDNDDLRRGKPACHKVFGYSTAILAGDALQSLAFEILSSIPDKDLSPCVKVKMVRLLAHAIGSKGMVGGEVLDLEMVTHSLTSVKNLEDVYQLKTGKLLTTSVLFGALSAHCEDEKILYYLKKFGEYIGISFQIHDDIIGIESDTKILGKKQGADLEHNKPIYPVIAGIDRAKKRQTQLYKKALNCLDQIAGFNISQLKAIASYIINRNY